MECSRVSSLLSRYIDGDLTPESRRMVDEHLSGCERCSADLDEMAGAVRALSSLERVAAPQGFLGRVHERLEEPSRARRFLRSLFSPARIKLPLEAAGLGIAILLIVFVHRETVTFKEKALVQNLAEVPAPAPPPSHKVASAPVEETAPARSVSEEAAPSVKKEAAPAPAPMQKAKTAARVQPGPSPEGSAAAPERYALAPPVPGKRPPASTGKPVQLALSILPSVKPQEEARRSPSTAATPPTGGSATPLRSAEDRANEGKTGGANQPPVLGETSRALRQSTMPLPRQSATAKTAADRERMAVDPGEALTRIGRCAASAGGAILKTEYAPGTGNPQSIVVEVPASGYATFLEELQRIGLLRRPYPESPPPGALPSVLIRVSLLPSD